MVKNWEVLRSISPWKKPFHLLRAQLARFWIKRFSKVEVIAITGSVGKTTAKEAIFQVLGTKFNVLKTIENFDPIFNIPETLLSVRSKTQKVVLEMGVEYPGEMDFYLSQVKPRIGVVTQISWAHTEFFKDIDGVLTEKSKMVKVLPENGWAVLNWDDLNVRSLAKETCAKIFRFGSNSKVCDLWLENFKQDFSGSQFSISKKGKTRKVSWDLVGRQNAISALAAASVGLICGLEMEEICQALSRFQIQKSRMLIRRMGRNLIILDDCYNSSPLAAKTALETLNELSVGKRKIAVLGDMLELGTFSKRAHQELGEEVVKNNVDLLFSLGENSKATVEVAKKVLGKKARWFKSKETLINKLNLEVKKGDVILVKGSRAMNLEKVIEKIKL